jgi:hypothetical protein
MMQKWFRRCFIVGFFAVLFLPSQNCFAQMQMQQRMQGSPEVRDFKERQQKKMQDYLAKFQEENNAFMSTLAGMQRDQKIIAVRDFIRNQYDKNSAFRKQMYEEQRAFIQKRLNANPNVQPFIEEKMLSRIDRDYQELKAFHAGKIAEDMEFLAGLLKDKSIDGQELNTKLQEFFQSQKADAQQFLQNQQRKYKSPQQTNMMR